jgi:CheY-like chemotaxis protein
MSGKKILVIDDSATIRRLADNALSQAGYQIALAASAEEGMRLAEELVPDLILLDHQLPGTTGELVCRQLLDRPALARIPVVASSTLRKRAYVQYAELPNVVDMLPKPYTAELLTTTVANAMDTASIVVNSQVEGTSVPETIQEVGDGDLCGVFRNFHVREVLDFLNNAGKTGTLELQGAGRRIYVYLADGRVLGVSATGIEPDTVMKNLPESLQSLAPVLRHTLRGRSCAEIDGLVELLDRKVVDARLLRRLLQHQAAVLMLQAFLHPLQDFRFEFGRAAPALHRKLSINCSVLALLIEGAQAAAVELLPAADSEDVFVRAAVRGQNLDRAAVAAQHLKLLNLLTQPHSRDEAARAAQLDADETQRVLTALCLAQLVEKQRRGAVRQAVIFDADQEAAQRLRSALELPDRYLVKIVRDRLALQLVLRRNRPDVLVLALDETNLAWARSLCQQLARGGPTRLVGLVADRASRDRILSAQDESWPLHAVLTRPLDAHALVRTWDQLFDESHGSPSASPADDSSENEEQVWSSVYSHSESSPPH